MADKDSKQKRKEQKVEDSGDMSFLGHLEELRKRIVYSLISVIVFSIIAGIFIDQIMEYVLLTPATSVGLKLQNLKPFGQPFLYFKVIFVCGFIGAFPFFLFQLWKFISPGLYDNEKKWVRSITFFTSLCFFSGIAFAYFVMLPSMLGFASSFGSDDIANIIDINEFFSFISLIVLAAGILFELPMIAWVLARIGIMTPEFMRKYRRHAIVVILILAAILTPTPDPISQMIFATPLFFLYELSIFIAKAAYRKHQKGLAG
jgi:sec-independent protein translocase protein TatC